MAREWIADDSGDGMWLTRGPNNRFIGNSFDPVATQNVPNVTLRSDDILLCSYSKTGTHWLWENMRILLSGEIQLDKVEKGSMMMEYSTNLDELPSPRILNNHAFFEDQPRDLLKGQNKVVFIYRNPKDVALSLFYHISGIPSYGYNGIFSNFQRRFLQGNIVNNSYFEFLQSWEKGLEANKTISCLLMRYEDLHHNPIAERRRLADFIGREYEDSFLQQVAAATSIETMRFLKADSEASKLKASDGASIVYRKGKVGDWKEHFTVSESEYFDKVVEREMGDSKLFQFIYSLD